MVRLTLVKKNYANIKRVRKTINIAAYCSLILDIGIAIVTTLSILNIGRPEPFLIPLNYMLTIVVALSIGLFITLVFLRHQEGILDKLLQRKYRYRPKSRSFLYKLKIKSLSLMKKIKTKSLPLLKKIMKKLKTFNLLG